MDLEEVPEPIGGDPSEPGSAGTRGPTRASLLHANPQGGAVAGPARQQGSLLRWYDEPSHASGHGHPTGTAKPPPLGKALRRPSPDAGPLLPEVDVPDLLRPRPLGVTLLSLLLLTGGGLGILLGAVAVLGPPDEGDALLIELGISPRANTAVGTLFQVLAFVAGAGLWAGRRWAWYLTAGFFVAGLEILGPAWWFLSRLEEVQPAGDVEYLPLVKGIVLGVSAVPSLLFLAYLFRRRIEAYFGLPPRKRGIRLAALSAGAIPLPLAWSLVVL